MDKENERIGLQEIIDKAIEELAREAGDSFKLDQLNLAEFSRRTGAVALESAIAEGEGLRRDAARKMRDKGQVNGHQWLRGGGEHPADGGRNELRGRLRAHREPGLQGRKDYCQELHLRAREPGSRQAQARQG